MSVIGHDKHILVANIYLTCFQRIVSYDTMSSMTKLIGIVNFMGQEATALVLAASSKIGT